MTVRAPLFVNGSNELQEMTTTQVNEIINHITYQYGLNPSVTITVGTTNVNVTSHFGNLTDNRYRSGSSITRADRFATASELSNPLAITPIAFNRMTRTFASVTPTSDTGTTFPVYYTGGGDGHVRAMSLQDMKDTFFHPAIELLIAGDGTADTNAGTYRMKETSGPDTGESVVSNNPIFIDTKANISSFTAGGIGGSGSVRDFESIHKAYYLHIKDAPSEPSYTAPVFINGSNNLQQYSTTNFGSLVQGWIRKTASESTDGYQIQYNLDGSGNTRGTIQDTRFETSTDAQTGSRLTRFVNANDYRAQDRPAGSLTVHAQFLFKITRG